MNSIIKGVINTFKNISLLLSDRQLIFLMFIVKHKYIPRLKNPRSISEKINYIKLYNRNPLRKKVVDRLEVRKYIKNFNTECKLPEILWHGVEFNTDIWNSLPSEFVIKANHGSKMTLIVDKNKSEFLKVREIVLSWLKKDYSSYGREWMYENLDKYLLVEEKLNVNGSVPPDFKFFVLNGKVELVQVDLDRFGSHRRNIYSRDFIKLNATYGYPSGENNEKPKGYYNAVRIAEDLSIDFDFIRVDLYFVNGDIYFGELTNTPENGFVKFTPRSLDFELGAKLPDRIER